mmetsp:Transcript_17935/g.36994  ORF Transcript_17935/g.36994 Transcript_17935/m.36994 type:complete len:169 (+) Transcript_17935:234-740(+)
MGLGAGASRLHECLAEWQGEGKGDPLLKEEAWLEANPLLSAAERKTKLRPPMETTMSEPGRLLEEMIASKSDRVPAEQDIPLRTSRADLQTHAIMTTSTLRPAKLLPMATHATSVKPANSSSLHAVRSSFACIPSKHRVHTPRVPAASGAHGAQVSPKPLGSWPSGQT